jgi:hypothetical protein
MQLVYERGSVPNSIEVLTKEGLVLGQLIGDAFFATLTFEQHTKMNLADVEEVRMVAVEIAKAMGYALI